MRWSDSEKAGDLFEDTSIMKFLFNRGHAREIPRKEVEQFAHKLYDALTIFEIEKIESSKDIMMSYNRIKGKNGEPSAMSGMFKEQINKALAILEKLFEDLDKDMYLVDYVRESVSQTLRIEFANQIQPVSKVVKSSKIVLTQNNSICFDFEINDNKIVNNGKPIFISTPYKRAYFVDDPFILDSPQMVRFYRYQNETVSESILNSERICTHANLLKFVLKKKIPPTVFEETVLSKSLSEIKAQIDQVIPGEFEFNSDGEYYVQNGSKLKISNLATGSKMFSILKILLTKGEINDTTMLILDEPEAHLHPSWQNKFAEIIVLLVKELYTNILLTTHSSNFMLAIDAYMRKHDISKKTNFYQTNYLNDGFVEYQCVNDDMGKIYADFMQYLSEVKVLRDNYMGI